MIDDNPCVEETNVTNGADYPHPEVLFLQRLDDLGVPLWVATIAEYGDAECSRPKDWQNLTHEENDDRLAGYHAEYAPYVAVNTGLPFVVFDCDTKNGCDVEKVRALLARLKVRIYADVITPSGGRHFYIRGHPDLVTVHSRRDNPKLVDFPGLDIQSFRANVWAPGTFRYKHGFFVGGYTIVYDHLDQLTPDDAADDGTEALVDWLAEQLALRVKEKAAKTPGGAEEWAWDPCEPWDGTPPDRRQQAYMNAALASEAHKVARTAEGGRNDALFVAALKLGSYVAGAGLDESVVIAALEEAAEANGYAAEDGLFATRATIRSGLRGAKKNPRAVPEPKQHGGEAMGDDKDKTQNNGQKPERTISWRTAAQIRDRRPEWAWTHQGGGRLPRSALSLFAARPGVGKSTAARWFAAGYTRGTIEGCFYDQPCNVAYIASEESLEAMVKPSLRAVDADMDRIHFPKVEVDGQAARLLSVVDEAALTADFIKRGISVVIVDPVMSTVGGKADLNRNNEVRDYLEPWARMAEAINGLMLGIVHLIKVPGGDIVAAINGSSAFGEVARAVIAFAQDTAADDGTGVLSQEKNNAGRIDLALEYTIESTTVQTDDLLPAEVARFVLGGPSDRRVADVLRTNSAGEHLGARSWEVVEVVRNSAVPVGADVVCAAISGLSRNDASQYLRRLARAGLLTKPARGVYEYRRSLGDRFGASV